MPTENTTSSFFNLSSSTAPKRSFIMNNCDNDVCRSRVLFETMRHTTMTLISGTMIPRLTSIVSAASSFMIIHVISKSAKGFHTIYHRIMLGMSICDVLVSMAIGLATLPVVIMPEVGTTVIDMISGSEKQNYLGNTPDISTMQVFVLVLGSYAAWSYMGSMCMYHAFAIGFSVQDSRLQRLVEPFLHITPFTMGLVVAISFLVPLMSSLPSDQLRCVVPEPFSLHGYKDDVCMKDDHSSSGARIDMKIALFCITLDLVVIIISLVIVFQKIYKQSQLIANYYRNANDDGNRSPLTREMNLRHHIAKTTSLQSLAYTGPLLLIAFLQMINSFRSMIGDLGTSELKLFILSLQGLLHFIVFLGGKISTIRYLNPEISYAHIFLRLIHVRNDELSANQGHFTHIEFDLDENLGSVWDWDVQSLRSNPSLNEDDYSAAVSIISHRSLDFPEIQDDQQEQVPSQVRVVTPERRRRTGKFKLKIQRRGRLYTERDMRR